MSGIGIFSPPLMITRTDDRSRASMSGSAMMALTMAGASHTVVTRDRSSSSTTAAASNTRWMIMVAPAAISEVVVRSSAPTWYSGPQASPRSALGEAELHDVGEVLPRQVGVGEHHALGPAGGAGGVHQAVDVVGGGGEVRPRWPAAEVGQRRPSVGGRGRGGGPHEGGLDALGRLVGQLDQGLVAHQGPRAGVLEDVPHLGRREPPVDRHRDGAQVVGGEDRLQELGAVVREQGHDIAGATPRSASPPASAAARVAISP